MARLSKQMFDVPRDSLPVDPWTAPAQIVPPRERLSGRIFVRLPIHQRLPRPGSLLSHDEAPLDGRADQVEICVQVAPVSEQFPDTTDMTGITVGRSLVCAGPLPLPELPDQSST